MIFGLVTRKECYVLTWRAKFLLLLGLIGVAAAYVLVVPKFLSPTQPLGSGVLVVEGWMADSGLRATTNYFKMRKYQLIVTTGANIELGSWLGEHQTYAELGASRLRKLGMGTNQVIAVSAGEVKKDRTYHSAVALKKFLSRTHPEIKSVDVLSANVHARRSWMLFRRALEPEYKVGVYAIEPTDYEADRWWASSAGFRTVISETIAYVYALTTNPE
ncbi:MAG: ElyC/SanA/YdcF family protein [Verrucomicrobiota bacterium]|nr:ElyC/SanA/YdcF family protein [Verrucomicrobiota bacterium]